MKILGAAVIIAASFFAGHLYTEKQKKRMSDISALREFLEHIGMCIRMFSTPLFEIFHEYKSSYLDDRGFFDFIDNGIFYAAEKSGLIGGNEEKELLRLFDEKIGTGSAEDSVAICTFTVEKLKTLEEKLFQDFPGRQKTYKTIFILAGISIIIVLI